MSFERLPSFRASVALGIVFLVALAPCILAQSAGTAGLSGTITDASGAAVPNVAVTAY